MNKLSTILFSALLGTTSVNVLADEWQFEFTPYAWLAANEGGTGVYGKTETGTPYKSISAVDITIQDLADHLDFGTMFNLSAKKGDYLLISEFTYLDVTDEQSSTAGPNGGIAIKTELGITGSILDLAAGYRLIEKENFDLYGYAGFRYLDLEASLDISVNPDVFALNGRSGKTGDDWIDPVIGVHWNWKINDKFAFQGRAEVGGFSSQPEETYALTTTLNHKISDQWSMKYFYRYMSIDYADNGFIYNMDVSGPGIGASYAF